MYLLYWDVCVCVCVYTYIYIFIFLFQCPSIIKKFSNSSDLNLSSVRADLFTSMKMNKNTKKWRKELKRKSKAAKKINQSEQVSDNRFNHPGFSRHQESHISTLDDKFQKTSKSSSQPFLWKPHLAPGVHGKKYSDTEFLKPKNHSPFKVSKKKEMNKVRTVSGGTSKMAPPNSRVSKRKMSSQVTNQEEQIQQLKPCAVMLEKIPKEQKIKGHQKDIYNNKKKYVFDQWIFKIDENDDVFIKGHLRSVTLVYFFVYVSCLSMKVLICYICVEGVILSIH